MMTLPALLILSLWKLATSWGKDWLWFGEAVVRRLIALLSRSNCRIRSHHHLSEGKHLRWSFYSSPRVERLKGSGWNPCFCRFLSPWFLQIFCCNWGKQIWRYHSVKLWAQLWHFSPSFWAFPKYFKTNLKDKLFNKFFIFSLILCYFKKPVTNFLFKFFNEFIACFHSSDTMSVVDGRAFTESMMYYIFSLTF